MPTNLPHFHYHTDILAADPISYIKMNEVSGTALADSSGRGRPAVINSTSGIHYDRTGIPGTQDDTCITLTGTGHTNVISWGTDTGLAADIGHITVWWRNTCPMASLPSQQVILDIAGQFSFYLDTDGAHVHTNAGSNNDSHLGNTLDLVRPFDWGSWNFVVIEWNINEGIFATINSNLLLALNWDHTNWATGNAITLLKNISLPSGEIGVANGAIYNDSGFSNFYQEQWIEGSAISETTRFLDNPNSSYPGLLEIQRL